MNKINFDYLINNSRYLSLFYDLLIQIGDDIVNIYNSKFGVKLKEDKTPLTEADLLSNSKLLSMIKRNFSNYGIISEETQEYELFHNKIWVIDPLDGTKDFVNKTGDFSIMVGLLEKNKFGVFRPVLGMIYVPLKKKFYYAEKNKGTFLINSDKNVFKLNVNLKNNFSEFILVRSRSHFTDLDNKLLSLLNIKNVIKMGSIGIKFAALAEGDADLCYYTSSYLGLWDVCASEILVLEAGGCVFDKFGNDIYYDFNTKKVKNGIVGISNCNLKEDFLKVINKLIKS
jgi:3'(2'), 5'-bisphosphate nucleotidase